jgi:hypothetical protein
MKGLRLYLILGGVVMIIYIIAQFNRPKSIDWTETLNSKDKIPNGTFILNERIKDLFPHSQIVTFRQPVYNVIVDDSAKNSSYIIICPGIDLSKDDYKKLIGYIKKGNDVFIAAENFGDRLDTTLDIETKTSMGFIKYPVTPINFVSPHLDSAKYYRVDKGSTNIFFSDFDTTKAVVLGKSIRNKANFLRFTFGSGHLFLLANPKMFSNYSLLKTDGERYAATALSFVKSTPKILWDEYYTQGDVGEDSPMRVFFSNTYLQWAYYITIFSLLLFVLYEIKRRQRIIPVTDPLNNSTLDFVNVVGQLYYEKRNNANIARKQVLYLLDHLRNEYQIKAALGDDEFLEKLTGKLGLDEEFATDFTRYLQFISIQERVSDAELIKLNKLIEQFYIKSR